MSLFTPNTPDTPDDADNAAWFAWRAEVDRRLNAVRPSHSGQAGLDRVCELGDLPARSEAA